MKPLLILRISLSSLILATATMADVALYTPRVFQDGSIQLRWASETGAVYAIESTETLNLGPSGVIPFVTRDNRVVSQGAETGWLDYGDASFLWSLPHPYDAPKRFYRVQKVGQSSEPTVAVSILQPAPAALLSGDVAVEVSITTTSAVGRIRLFVDGQPVDEAWTVETAQFSINTTEWINGSHTIHATAELASESGTTGAPGNPQPPEPGVGASAPLVVTFDNLIHDFTVVTPYFDPYDPYYPEIQVVYAALTVESDWTLTIVDENAAGVRSFSGSGTSSFIQWDGTDSFGTPLPPGFYDYILTATPQQSQSATAPGTSATPATAAPLQAASLTSTPRGKSLSEQFRTLIPVPNAPVQSRLLLKPATQRVPWFMQPKPDPAASLSNAPAFVVPPFPPLVRTKFNIQNWDALLTDYLQKSNNMVQAAMENFAMTLVAREQLLAERVAAMMAATAVPEPVPSAFLEANPGGQTAQNPRRVPGRTQMAYTGAAGAISQGHHPTTNQAAWSYGPLAKANVAAEGFVNQMAKGASSTRFPAWKKSFHLKDDQVLRTNLVGRGYDPGSGTIDSSQSSFNRNANIGFLVGHTLEYNPPGFPQNPFGPLAAYPLYNTKMTNGYTWIPDMEMRFGSQWLRWMGYYGCNVLREPRWTEVWSRFTWPINYYCNVYCATASSIYMYDTTGRLWAQGMQGELNGTPMTIVDAWVEAGRRATAAENDSRRKRGLPLIGHAVKMSYLYWNATQEGGDNTLNDRFKPMQIGSTSGRSVENLHYGEQTVLTP